MNTALVVSSCSWTHWMNFGPIEEPAAPPDSIRTTPNTFTRPWASSVYLLARQNTGVAELPSDISQPACFICRATVERWCLCSSWTPITSAPDAPIANRPATIRLVLFDFSTFQVPIRIASSAPTAPRRQRHTRVGANAAAAICRGRSRVLPGRGSGRGWLAGGSGRGG